MRDKSINWDDVDVVLWDAYIASFGHDDFDVVLWDDGESWPDNLAIIPTIVGEGETP